jgi:hypothetical protein
VIVKLSALGFAALTCVVVGCVVTTHEGVGEPPRGGSKPIWPPLGEPGLVPDPAAGGNEPTAEGDGGQEEGEPGATMPESIVASHILVMYKGSLRAPERVQRTKEEAKKRAEEALTRAKAGENFAELVGEYSDEPGAGSRGGSLGRFRRGMMIKPFESVAFKLKPGEISDLVETPFGYHIILRTE